jgi:selenide,water dikinase
MRLTSYSRGGGCACKVPPGELEELLGKLPISIGAPGRRLLVGPETGDDAAVVQLDGQDVAWVSTVDFFTPVVDDAYAWGAIAAANAFSDVYAMGGTPVVGLNLLCWPRDSLPMELAAEVMRGGVDIANEAGVFLAGGHSIDDAEPKYGVAVSGTVVPAQLIRNSSGRAGLPLTLTKPIGTGVLNNRHKATAETFPEAIAAMMQLNAAASELAVRAGIECGTDVTGFGLLGHAFKLARASNVTVVIDAKSVPLLEGARESAELGFVSGGTRRNLDWVAPHADFGSDVGEVDRLLLADAQTSGGLLVVGELPGYPVIGELVARRGAVVEVR